MNPLNFFHEHRVGVFPISHGTKVPAVPKGTNWQDWDDFVRPRPVMPYGVVLGSLLVVDGDTAAATAWIRAHVPETPFRVQTGPYHDGSSGRGVHFYYRAPSVATPAYIHRDHLAIEARRAGQYVVGPESKHPTGCTYKVSHDWTWRWEDIPTFPADFVFEDGSVRPIAVEGAPYVMPAGIVTAGERTDQLFRFLRSCKARGECKEDALNSVKLFNIARCEPPKSDAWLRSWFGRAWNQSDRPDFNQERPLIELELGL